ncbi:MAG TPA: hypothetical protein VGN11_10445 [Candidatus Baltobacteraceae bacterium]|nr:hypothetical protein [Candidatus Baltobacteraceae bacterium]
MTRLWASALYAGLSAVFILVSFALAQRGVVEHQSFKAFYCAGAAVREHLDPQRVEPLRSCERRFETDAMAPGYVEPAPLPGYALAPFALLSRLPARAAAEVFAVVLALATIGSAYFLATVTGAPRAAVLLALAPLALLNVAYGELPPLPLLGMCACAFYLTKRQWIPAAVAASIVLFQPNIGLPAVLAVGVFAPRTRLWLALCVLILAGLSIAILGVAQNLTYFSAVLPLQAHSELGAADQYSFSHVLYESGAAPNLAILYGKVWFACMGIIGFGIAGIAALRSRIVELLPLLPPAIALLGGIYVHDIQMLLAIPAALFVASRVRRRTYAALAVAALAVLVAVWTQRLGRAALLVDAAGVAAAVFAVVHQPLMRRLILSIGAAVVVIACITVAQRVAPPVTGAAVVTQSFDASPLEFTAVAWERYLNASPALMHQSFLLKVPTWLALAALMVASIGLCGKREAAAEDDRVESAMLAPSG